MTNMTDHDDGTNTAGTTGGSEAGGTIFTYTSPHLRPRRDKPLDPHLFIPDEREGVSHVHVQTGYPVWNLIAAWMASNYDDEQVLADYSDMPRAEWEAAKRYYLAHKLFIDARIVLNSEPYAEDDVPPMASADEYYAYLIRQEAEEAARDTNTSAQGAR
jgi:uncharacterized protein (DUF433 family)